MKQCSSRCRRRFSLPLPEYVIQDYYRRMPRLRARLCPRHIGVGCFSMPARRCALVSLKTLLCKAEKSQVGPSFLEKSACRDKAGTRRSYSLPCLHLYGPTFLTNQIQRLFCPRGAAFHRDQPARSPTIQSERQLISERQSGRWRYLGGTSCQLQQAS